VAAIGDIKRFDSPQKYRNVFSHVPSTKVHDAALPLLQPLASVAASAARRSRPEE
jgi:hypothetical protein